MVSDILYSGVHEHVAFKQLKCYCCEFESNLYVYDIICNENKSIELGEKS